ncbi:MAG: UbiA family prenyltransferase [Methanobacteriota archaeon]
MRTLLADYARLLRLPGLGGLSIAPVFGAISVGVLDLRVLSILFLIGAFSSIYGFVLNDYIDVEVDKLSKELSNRPLVKGTISCRTALLICLLCVIGTFITIFLVFYNTYPSFVFGILCILLSAVFGSFYNFYGKRFIGSDLIVALSEALLVLFGAYMVVQGGALTIYTWLIFLLTFNQLVYENAVSGGIKDADHDPLMKVKNIALATGVKVTPENNLHIPHTFQAFGLGIRLFSAGLIFIPAVFYHQIYHYEWWHIGLLLLFVIGVLFTSGKMLSLKTFERNKLRKLITMQAFLRYSLVPLMLIPLITLLPAIVLILFPFIWYILFTPMIGEKLFRPGL